MLSKLRKNAPHEGLGTSSFDDLFWSCASDVSIWRFCLRAVGTRTLSLGTLLFRFEIASIGPEHVSEITWLSSSLPCLLGILFLRFRKRLRCGSCCSRIVYKVRFGSLFGKNYPLGRPMSREATLPKRQIELLSFSRRQGDVGYSERVFRRDNTILSPTVTQLVSELQRTGTTLSFKRTETLLSINQAPTFLISVVC
jgi:hypothetical protein